MAVRAGTELGLAVDAAKELEKDGKKIRVVSLVSWELFEEQGKEYKASILLHFCLFQPLHAEFHFLMLAAILWEPLLLA